MNTRRIIAFLLACMMILTLVPGVFAEEEHTHEWVETVMKKADCEHTGVLKKECECGEVIYELIDLAHEKEERIVEATCTVEASIEVVCILCEKVLETKVIDDENNVPLGHDLVVDKDHEDYKGETCTEGGVAPMKCTRCDYTETQTPDAHGHKWSEDGVHTDAHCDHGAGLEYICTVCGDTKVEEYTEGDKVEEAIGHEFEEEVIAPTCEDEGYTLVTCKNCDYEEKKDTVPADPTAHSSVLDVMLKAPTCTVSGTGKYKCELCEADLGYKVIPAGHTWTEVEGTKTPATCGKDGKVDVICSVCGESEEQVLPALSDKHNFVEKVKDATCTEPAKIGMICENCGAVDGELIDIEGGKPLGHDLVLDEENEDYKPGTCTEAGVATLICSRCDYTEIGVIEPLGHVWSEEGVWVDAGCENPAGIGYVCTVCGDVKVDAVSGETAEAPKGHKYVEKVIEATCTNEGVTVMICENCGHSYEVEGTKTPIVPTAHVPVVVDVIKEADCDETGIVKLACEECEKELGYKTTPEYHVYSEDMKNEAETAVYHVCTLCNKVEIIETTEDYEECADDQHIVIISASKAPTCTEAGYTEGKYCVLCEEVFSVKEELPALGHTEEILPAVDATCAETGLTEGKVCSVCGEILTAQEEVPTVDHTEEILPAVDATCIETGLTEGKACSVCGEILTAQEEVPAGDHTEETIPAVDATCTETGLTEGVKCSVCGEIITAQTEVAALGHDFEEEWTVDIEATADKEGSKSRHCTRCDEVTDVIVIEKLVVIVDSAELFTDLEIKSWSKEGIDYVVSYGYMKGTGDGTTFDQNGIMTRSMIVSVLNRIAGNPTPESTNPFADLEAGQTWYHDAVIWAYENGIVTGTSSTTFAPSGEVTREQMATFLYRFAQYMDADVSEKADITSFPDADKVGSWAADAIAWANAEGLITGVKGSDGVIRLDPQGKATREQVATILMRFCKAMEA